MKLQLYIRINEEKLDPLPMAKTSNELKTIIERKKEQLPNIVDNNEAALIKLYTEVCI